MANQEHLDKLNEGVGAWNQWRDKNKGILPDLSNINLTRENFWHFELSDLEVNSLDLKRAEFIKASLASTDSDNANLSYVNFSHANLSNTTLNKVNLSYANFDYATLRNTDFSRTDLRNASLVSVDSEDTNFSNANLSNVNLSNAILYKANFRNAILHKANLSGSGLYETIFSEVDLRQTRGLLEINHSGPSNISLHNVQLPQDGSTLSFLRGAGVPDEWIDFYQATMQQPIQYYSLFISYSSKDEAFARRLYADLQSHNVRCWFAPMI